MTLISLEKLAQHRGTSADSLTEERCPCGECHPEGAPLLTVYESCARMCVSCLNRHAQVIVETRESKAIELKMLLRTSGVPAGYADFSWGTWLGEVPARLNTWWGEPWSVLFYGPPGTGKTHAATSIARAWIEHGERRVVWRDAARFVQSLREAIDSKNGEHVYRAAANAKLLILDDLCAEYLTEWGVSRLSELIRERESEGRATVITTNRPVSDLAQLDARIASRLVAGLRVAMEGRDQRTANAEDRRTLFTAPDPPLAAAGGAR